MNLPTILKMSPIQESTFKRAIIMLDSMKCVYAIIDPLGNKHGILNIDGPKRSKKLPKHPHGQRATYIRKHIESMSVGDAVQIPFDKFGGPDLQTSTASTALRLWGQGSVTTTIVRDSQVLEVMRIF